VGCGSSTLGEFLVQDLHYSKVVNVDIDEDTLHRMEARWFSNSDDDSSKMEFTRVDLAKESVPYPCKSFDLVVDKSTLDCTLCSDDATTGLLCEAYRALKENGGVYLVISFHHLDLLLPLLRGLPGAHWTVSHQVMNRQVEDLIGKKCSSDDGSTKEENAESGRMVGSPPSDVSHQPPCWDYRKTVNVILCRRLPGGDPVLDRDQVREHIYKTNDVWFRSQNPMMDVERKKVLQGAFAEHAGREMHLDKAYEILFTEAERDHLTYEYFLEDWEAFIEHHLELPKDRMSLQTAIAFLEEMQ
jgi:SAM-dependent methyltransferase